jgi:hypothetical protein
MLSAYHTDSAPCSHLNERQGLDWPGRAPMPDDRRASTVFRFFQNITTHSTHSGYFVVIPRFAPMSQPASGKGGRGSVMTRGMSTF